MCVAEGYRVDELMARQSRRILLSALDRMVYSSANYWVVMLSDLAAALAFLALGLNRFSGPWLAASPSWGSCLVDCSSTSCIGGSCTAHLLWRGAVTPNTTQSPERSSARHSSSS